ncbi:hypothetical protein DRP77_02095 [Candidatus Poribacteria bacterium]|nr:MAG: hypothetical protein DRP77_02095 [Candidatus Poribacteria bacterium]
MRKGYLVLIYLLIVAVGALIFAHIWLNTKARMDAMRMRELERERMVLVSQIDKLRSRWEYLTSPENLESLARKFGMSLPQTEPKLIVK